MLGAMASGLWRGAVVLIMAVAACAGPGGDLPALSGVDIDESQGTLALVTGCYDRVGGDAVLRDGQIVVTDLWGEGGSHNDCARGVPLDLGPGPDVVYPRGEQRFALVGDRCAGEPERVLLAAQDGIWDATGFEAELFCPDPAASYGVPDLPAWVCDP